MPIYRGLFAAFANSPGVPARDEIQFLLKIGITDFEFSIDPQIIRK
jgi:hypothetical protein